MDSINRLLDTYSFRQRELRVPLIVSGIESKFGCELPSDYKLFLENYEAFEDFIGNEYVRLWGAEDIIEANTDYQIPLQFFNVLGIGGNGAGEFIGLEYRQYAVDRVIISPLIFTDSNDHIKIGDSFFDFLLRLHKGKDWFE
ncbi:SMI1/KNR4 family protein [Lewinella sp. IMCC34191]|uniref:SMI1/KNR4 family protein n=1 Tax=Lewinella sp. IMCC34191 TaxID=2259172 RepID=UPI000E24F668|nr:SMI1/KNR4 family protein [Lewinella sp. IMCC34191]